MEEYYIVYNKYSREIWGEGYTQNEAMDVARQSGVYNDTVIDEDFITIRASEKLYTIADRMDEIRAIPWSIHNDVAYMDFEIKGLKQQAKEEKKQQQLNDFRLLSLDDKLIEIYKKLI